jgi:hypothetical protein
MAENQSPFTRVVPGSYKPRLIVATWGLSKEGKTHNALTWPQPIFYLGFDQGVRELLMKPEFADLEIHEVLDGNGRNKLYIPDKFDLRESLGIMREFDQAYDWALARGEGTVVIDTATQLNQLVQDIELQPIRDKRRRKAEKKGEEYDEVIYPFDYSNAGRKMRGVYLKASQYHDINVVFVHRAREKYDSSGKALGLYDPQWYTETPSLVQMVVNIRLVRIKPATTTSPAEFQVRGLIERNRWTQDTVGWDIENPTYRDFCLAAGWTEKGTE